MRRFEFYYNHEMLASVKSKIRMVCLASSHSSPRFFENEMVVDRCTYELQFTVKFIVRCLALGTVHGTEY